MDSALWSVNWCTLAETTYVSLQRRVFVLFDLLQLAVKAVPERDIPSRSPYLVRIFLIDVMIYKRSSTASTSQRYAIIEGICIVPFIHMVQRCTCSSMFLVIVSFNLPW